MRRAWKWMGYVLVIGGMLSLLMACGTKPDAPAGNTGSPLQWTKESLHLILHYRI